MPCGEEVDALVDGVVKSMESIETRTISKIMQVHRLASAGSVMSANEIFATDSDGNQDGSDEADDVIVASNILRAQILEYFNKKATLEVPKKQRNVAEPANASRGKKEANQEGED